VVHDLEAALARAEQAGARREGETGDFAWGRIANLRDPFGHGFCLVELSREGYAAVDDRGPAGA
jgi:lactoylglutathione lyase